MSEVQANGAAQPDAAAVAAAAAANAGVQNQDGAANDGAANGAANDAGKTIAEGGEGKAEVQEKPYWPDDWREKAAQHYSAGDEKAYKRELKRLQGVTDPAGMYGMYRELESKFTSGGLIKKPGKDAKPEEVSEFHKAIGVPEKVEDYFKDLKLDNGAVLGDADKPLASAFAEAMHKAGTPAPAVQAALNWYFANQENQAAALDEFDDSFRKESEQQLKEEYGPALKRMTNSVAGLFAAAPGGTDLKNEGSLYARLMGGRTADGKLIGNDPDIVRWMVGLVREVNPAATVVEDGAGGGKSIDTEISEIETVMRTDRRRYDKDLAPRYAQLLAAREKIQARSRA